MSDSCSPSGSAVRSEPSSAIDSSALRMSMILRRSAAPISLSTPLTALRNLAMLRERYGDDRSSTSGCAVCSSASAPKNRPTS